MLKIVKSVAEFDSFIKQNLNVPVLIKFFIENCYPCRQLKSSEHWKVLEKEDKNELIVIEIDAERFPELAQRELFDVKSVPTLFLFLAGKKIKERRGYLSEEELKNFLNN